MNNKFLTPYYLLVDFLADYLGENTEVVLHDFTDLEHSIVKIRNGYISGRNEGDPATDFVMKILNKKNNEKYICNYKSNSKGSKTLKSASFFIRDNRNKIVGMLCLNMNVESMLSAQSFLESFLSGFNKTINLKEDYNENLGLSINEIIDSSIARALSKSQKSPSDFTVSDRELAVARMNDEGLFLLKGAISKVASVLNISEPTLYRYIKKAKS